MTKASAARATASASGCGSWPWKRTRSATPSDAARPSSAARSGPSPTDVVGDVGQRRQHAQHLGVALARDEVRDGRDRPPAGGAARCGLRRHVGPQPHDLDVAGADRAAELGGPRRVGQHEPRSGERPRDVRRALGGVEDVAAVDRDDERLGAPEPAHRVARRHRVVRVDDVERPVGRQRAAQTRRRPRAP
jgi:hypothetical protein